MKKKLFLLIVLAHTIAHNRLYAGQPEKQASPVVSVGDDMFEENPDEDVQDFFTIDIVPPKKTFSFRDIPLYATLFFGYLFENRIRPAYYALLGYVIGGQNKVEIKQ